MFSENQQIAQIETNATSDHFPWKGILCSYVQLCTFIVNECLVNPNIDLFCSEEDLYVLFKASCLKEDSPMVSRESFRNILGNLGFLYRDNNDGDPYFEGIEYKSNSVNEDTLNLFDDNTPETIDFWLDDSYVIYKGNVLNEHLGY